MTQDEVTTAQAAPLLRVSERTVRRMIARGTLKARKIDPTAKSVYKIPMAEIDRLLREWDTATDPGERAPRPARD